MTVRVRALLLLVLAAGALLRVETIRSRIDREVDDALAIATASGHPRSAGLALEGRWVPASAWQDLSRPLGGAGAAAVAANVAGYGNVHPPLWYWVVHAVTRAFGAGLWSVPLLNLAFALATGAAVFLLVRRLLGSAEAALAAAALWAFSPGAIGTTVLERPYELLALLTVLLVGRFLPGPPAGRRASLPHLLPVVLLSAAGLLLHYQFLFVLAVCVLLLLLPSPASAGARLAAAGALTLGALLHLAVFPDFLRALRMSRQPATAGRGGLAGFAERLASPVQPGVTLLDHSFFTPPWSGAWSVLLAVCWTAALAALLLVLVRARPRPAAGPGGRALLAGLALLGLAWAAFLFGATPPHATSSRYVSNAYPLLAVGLAGAIALLPSGRTQVAAALAALQLAGGLVSVAAYREGARTGLAGIAVLRSADAVYLDNGQAGVFPRVAALLAPGTPLFVAWNGRLLGRPADFFEALPEGIRRIAWVSARYKWDPSRPGDDEAVDRLLRERGFDGIAASAPLLRVGAVRLYVRRAAP